MGDANSSLPKCSVVSWLTTGIEGGSAETYRSERSKDASYSPPPRMWNGTRVACASFCCLAFVLLYALRSFYLLHIIDLENDRPVILTEGS